MDLWLRPLRGSCHRLLSLRRYAAFLQLRCCLRCRVCELWVWAAFAAEWSYFVLVESVEAGIDSVAVGTADGATEVFNLAGVKVADTVNNLPAGIYFLRKGSTVKKIAVR